MAGHLTDSQVGQLREMPPPPQRRLNKQQLSEDSQLGRCVDCEPAEKGEKEKDSSAVSGALPPGFFEGGPPKKMKKLESNEFDTFMQEISALGAVKNNKDGTVVEVEEDDHGRHLRRNEQEGGEQGEVNDVGSVHVSQEDYADDFEQFVRRERMKEVRQAAQNKTRPNDQESHQEIMAQISAMGSNNAVRIPDVSLPGRQSIADSYNFAMQAASDSNSSDSSEEDWRAKKL